MSGVYFRCETCGKRKLNPRPDRPKPRRFCSRKCIRFPKGTRRQRRIRPLHERFWARVKRGKRNECWPWTGGAGDSGYGHIFVRRIDGKREIAPVHRVAWTIAHKRRPPTMRKGKRICVCHHCDFRRCCNPRHLFLGTDKDNAIDKAIKGRIPYAKLSPRKVREIRAAAARNRRPGLTGRLARKYGVGRYAIWCVINRRYSWTHVK